MLTQTISQVQPTTRKSDTLLRRALQVDGVLELACGLGLLAFSTPITTMLGQPASSNWIALVAGLDLIPVGFFLLWLASRPTINLKLALGIAAVNDLFALSIGVILLTGMVPLQEGGVWLLSAVAIDFFILAVVQFFGIRQAAKKAAN